MKIILVFLALMACTAPHAAELDMPSDIDALAHTYSTCLGRAYDAAKQQHQAAIAQAKRDCHNERQSILHAFPAHQRAEVNQHITAMVTGGFEARRREQTREK